ncbi:MAG: DUF72 domain-containing protein [Spirochaetia bacterium]
MSVKIGTCSWNYSSWVGLVYDQTENRSADYLPQYAKKYNTTEIDSWFYKIPTEQEVLEYKENVPENFEFTCKAPRDITMPLLRNNEKSVNRDFLSSKKMDAFLNAVEPLLPQISVVMLEFEYLNKNKMSSVSRFVELLEGFVDKIPDSVPLGIEIRNSNYLRSEYFRFLKNKNIIPVLSEKQYMPPLPEIYKRFEQYMGDKLVFRLMGGDRTEIEEQTENRWNKIVQPKDSLSDIAELIKKIHEQKDVFVNINNHYEGSAPLTIEKLQKQLN